MKATRIVLTYKLQFGVNLLCKLTAKGGSKMKKYDLVKQRDPLLQNLN